MRIGVDLHVLQGINQGSKTYLDNIYTAAAKNPGNNSFVFYFESGKGVPDKWESLGDVRLLKPGSVRRLLWEAKQAEKKDSLDAFHSQYIIPVCSREHQFVTIHDVLFETHPQFFDPAFVLRSKLLIRYSAKKSRHIFTVSDYSKNQIIERYGVKPNMISVTPNGVCLDDFLDADQLCRQAKLKYGLKDYILTVGRLEPRKNHLSMLQAYNRLVISGKDVPQFVIVGQKDFRYSEIFDFVADNNLGSYVKFIFDSTWNDLIGLYRGALCFLYPSLAEGFGIPPLEAMAAGCPVITSDNTALGEIYRGAAHLVNPLDVSDIADAISYFLDNSSAIKTYVDKGADLVARFSWENSAKAMVSSFDAIR